MMISSECCCALRVSEIRPGLVLHLDPSQLELKGARCTCLAEQRVEGHHFFLCLDTDNSEGDWPPLYSNPGPLRQMLSSDGRRGHAKWTDGVFHFHPSQIWTVSHLAILGAAAAGNDQSTAGNRNMLDEEKIPIL